MNIYKTSLVLAIYKVVAGCVVFIISLSVKVSSYVYILKLESWCIYVFLIAYSSKWNTILTNDLKEEVEIFKNADNLCL